jgi:hypothetical protein
MKTPCPAFYIQPPLNPALPAVTVRPCIVVALYPSMQMATIELHSLQVSGRVSRNVPYADLASTAESAIKTASARISSRPALAEKSATPAMAGADAGALPV